MVSAGADRKKRVRVPVLVTLGVSPTVNASYSTSGCRGGERAGWLDAIRALAGRNLGTPELAVIDGNVEGQ